MHTIFLLTDAGDLVEVMDVTKEELLDAKYNGTLAKYIVQKVYEKVEEL